LRLPTFLGKRVVTEVTRESERNDEELGGAFMTRSEAVTFQQTKKLTDDRYQKCAIQCNFRFARIRGIFFSEESTTLIDFDTTRPRFGVSFIGDRRDSFANPTLGRFWNITFPGVPKIWGSDLGYIRLYGQFFYYYPLFKEWIWASGIRMGLATGTSKILLTDDRFLAGGRQRGQRVQTKRARALHHAPRNGGAHLRGRPSRHRLERGSSTELRLRSMDQLVPTALPGTEGATTPFFAPTGEEVGFFAGGKLQTLSLAGLRVRSLADGPSPRGASWGRGGQIVFSRCTVCGLESVIAESTTTRAATSLETARDEKSHRWPSVLPDGRSALFTSWTGSRFDIEWVSLDLGECLLLVEDGSYPRFASSGHLVFVRGETLMAAALDPEEPDRMGEPSLLLQNLHRDPLTGAAFYDISDDGTLVYVPRAEDMSDEVSGRLLLVDRDGSYRVALPTPRSYQVPRVSPTGKRLMFTLTVGEKTDVYITELARGTLGRVTFEGNNGAAIWSPDGRAVFSSDRDGEALNLYSKAVDGSEPVKRLTVSASHHFPSSWSPDGTVLAYTELNLETSLDIWLLSTASQGTQPWLQTAFNESAAAFSPDGKWLAYVSDETGEDEVYVSAFPGPGGKTTLSSGGGREPRWSPDGSELYYREKEWLMAVSVATGAGFDAGAPRRLFEAPFDEAGAPYADYDVSRESDGFIMVRTDEELSASRLVVVLNWFEELRRLVPTGP